MNTTSRIAAGVLLAASCAVATAQVAPNAPASQPAAVAVNPDTARAANEKAVQRSDVATVVRTGPSAADKAGQVKDDMQARTANATAADGTRVATNGTVDGMNRPPRTDRN